MEATHILGARVLDIDLIVIILFAIYSYIEGGREAVYDYYKLQKTTMDLGEHKVFTAQRSLVVMLIAVIYWAVGNDWQCVGLKTFTLCCTFPFVHDGAYYTYRHFFDEGVYPRQWWAQTVGSNAKINLTPVVRTLLFCIGLIGYSVIVYKQFGGL